MKQQDIEHRVRQINWPAPSTSLRATVLSAAVVAEQPITWSDRMWFSRTWRLSAVAAALVVVVLDQFAGSPRSAGYTPAPQALAEAQVIDDTARQVGLPADAAATLARRAMSEASRPQTQAPPGSTLFQPFDLEGTGGGR
jgi:hypothetical protein